MEKFVMTAEGHDALLKEVERLKHEERPKIIKEVASAREHGDLSENAEYHAAREKHSFIEGRIKELEDKLSRVEVIDNKDFDPSLVKFSAYVCLEDEDTGDEVAYRIVSDYEADIKRGLISNTAPLAKALMGRKLGESVEVNTPKGIRNYYIKSVKY